MGYGAVGAPQSELLEASLDLNLTLGSVGRGRNNILELHTSLEIK